jgi:acyl-coenzyme A thioesterase PaaI-like protein
MSEPDGDDALALEGGRNFVGDLDVASMLVTLERGLLWAPLTDAVRSAAGAASVGVLATFFDVIASTPTLAVCRPDWTATQSLSVHATDWLVEGPVVVDVSLVRVGKKVIVVAAEIWDGRGLDDDGDLLAAFDAVPCTTSSATADVGSTAVGRRSDAAGRGGSGGSGGPRLAARGVLTFARLPGGAGGEFAEGYDPRRWLGQITRRPADRTAEGTVWARIGLREIDGAAGVLELERIPYITNRIGTINGGALAMMVEKAAEAMRPALVATDLQVQYLSQVKVGPARTRGSVSRDGADHSVVTVEVVDHGADDQVLALAVVTLQAPPG